jgi:cytochrome c oxidase subunit I
MAVANVATHSADAHDHHDHEHHDNFISQSIFSPQDHKMIGKQFLVTGIFWAIIGGFLSLIFRLQLGFPDMELEWLRPFLGGWIDTPDGKLDPEFLSWPL